MRKIKLYHYYPDDKSDSDMTTACGRDGYKVGGLITYFFEKINIGHRCQTCHKRFEKDLKILENKG